MINGEDEVDVGGGLIIYKKVFYLIIYIILIITERIIESELSELIIDKYYIRKGGERFYYINK